MRISWTGAVQTVVCLNSYFIRYDDLLCEIEAEKKTSAREGLILIDNSPPFSKEMTNQHAISINNSRPFCKGMTNQHIV